MHARNIDELEETLYRKLSALQVHSDASGGSAARDAIVAANEHSALAKKKSDIQVAIVGQPNVGKVSIKRKTIEIIYI